MIKNHSELLSKNGILVTLKWGKSCEKIIHTSYMIGYSNEADFMNYSGRIMPIKL